MLMIIYIFVKHKQTINLKTIYMKNKNTHITQNITFKSSNKKKQAKLLDFVIQKFKKETNCSFVDFYLIGINKVLMHFDKK